MIRFFEETPGIGILRNLLYAIVVAFIQAWVLIIVWRFNAEFLRGYLLIGIGLLFFGWAGERLWNVTISHFFEHKNSWLALLSRIPLWGMFGGMGYASAIIISKKFGFINVQERPMTHVFYYGAIIGCAIQVSLYSLTTSSKQPTIDYRKQL